MGVGKVVEVRFPRGGGEADLMEIRKLTENNGKERDKEVPALANVHHHHPHQRHAESFVKDGIAFLWEAEPETLYQIALYKVRSLTGSSSGSRILT